MERWLFHPGSRDRVAATAPLSGEAFPRYFISDEMPVWDAALRGPWRLEISGAVRRPLSLGLDELMKLPATSQRVHHFCVEGWMARAEWTGVKLAEIARMVEPTPDAQYVDFQSFDSAYHESWDVDSALHPQTLIAYGMDGNVLGPGHGAPARVHSPVKLGYKNTKYLTRVVFMPARNVATGATRDMSGMAAPERRVTVRALATRFVAAPWAVVFAVLVTACSSQQKPAGDSAGAQTNAASTAARSPDTVTRAEGDRVAATPDTACPHWGPWRLCSVEYRLTRAGLVVHRQDKPARHDFMSVPGTVYTTASSELQVFIYPELNGARARHRCPGYRNRVSPRPARHLARSRNAGYVQQSCGHHHFA